MGRCWTTHIAHDARLDCTIFHTNIHSPFTVVLLYDSIDISIDINMSGLEIAGFILTICPLALKATQLALRVFDLYPSEEEYRDNLLVLDVQKNSFSTWVRSRRFTSQRALQYRLRSTGSQETREHIMEQYVLACRLILRVLTVMGEINVIINQSNAPPSDKLERKNRRGRKWIRSGPAKLQYQNKANTPSIATHLTGTTTAVSADPDPAISLRTQGTGNTAMGTRDDSYPRLAEYLTEAYSRIPDGPQKQQLMSKLDLLKEVLQRPSNTEDLMTSNSSSGLQRVKDVWRGIVVVDSKGKLNMLIGKIKEWNEALNSLLPELAGKYYQPWDLLSICFKILSSNIILIAKDISQPSDHSFRIPFEAPFARNPSFGGREDILENIELHLDSESSCKVVVLHGPGGYGKSEIAHEYAYISQQHYTSVIWIDATSSSTIKTSAESFLDKIAVHWPLAQKIPITSSKDYMVIARKLGIEINYNEESSFDRNMLRTKFAEDPVGILGNWLALQDNNRWLIVAENFNNSEETSKTLTSLIPNNDVGHLIMTMQTFRPNRLRLKGHVICLKVGGFEGDNGATLLGKLLNVDINKLHNKNEEGKLRGEFNNIQTRCLLSL